MHSIYELVTLEVQNKHNYEHDLEHRPLFNEPKIYDADADLNKRWYVYFSYRIPKKGKLERMKNIYGTCLCWLTSCLGFVIGCCGVNIRCMCALLK